MGRRKRFTLMPAIALAALSLMVALPTLSSVRLYAATAQRYATVTVRPGDTLWSIAAAHAGPNADVQETSIASPTRTTSRRHAPTRPTPPHTGVILRLGSG